MADTTQPAKVKVLPSPKGSGKSSQDVSDIIDARRSPELIIAICGAIGSGTEELDASLEEVLQEHGYKIERIKVSEFINKSKPALLSLTGADRYSQLQQQGNEIRRSRGMGRLAEEAIVKIVEVRKKYTSGNDRADEHKNTKTKVAYIINQLKHPSEVKVFQKVYRQNFYLLGIIRSEEERKGYLKQKGISVDKVDHLIHIDRKEETSYGQQLEKTFHLSDYFVRNKNNASSLTETVQRFVKLVHGHNGVTPTYDEIGMYTAFSASLESACLSRQVGAAIMNDKGDILSTGCNDVPAAGGGLYTAAFGEKDQRCIYSGKMCYNDHYKQNLKDEFKETLDIEIEALLSGDDKEGIRSQILQKTALFADKLLQNSRAKSLIEFSRAVHAEMAAIIQLARVEGQSIIGAILYCTTYPCHSCARHIVASGISKVVYIEPYEKSLAMALHGDAISDTNNQDKVFFTPFEGVAPARYLKFFKAQTRKNEQGKAIHVDRLTASHVDPQYLDDYYSYEDKVVERVVGVAGTE